MPKRIVFGISSKPGGSKRIGIQHPAALELVRTVEYLDGHGVQTDVELVQRVAAPRRIEDAHVVPARHHVIESRLHVHADLRRVDVVLRIGINRRPPGHADENGESYAFELHHNKPPVTRLRKCGPNGSKPGEVSGWI